MEKNGSEVWKLELRFLACPVFYVFYPLEPMTLESFYARIEESEKALERDEIITQDDLRKEIKTWKRT